MKVTMLSGRPEELMPRLEEWLKDRTREVKACGLAAGPNGTWFNALIFYEQKSEGVGIPEGDESKST